MKKITKEIEIYEYSELSKTAKDTALRDWNELNNEMIFLQSMLNDECGQLLKEHGIVCTSNHPVCMYSLSYCQGDGLMFEGSFTWNGYNVKIEHSGRYYHSNSKVIEIHDEEGNTVDTEEPYTKFEAIYQSICKKLQDTGYKMIEDETSEAHFIDVCNDNEWVFTKDGKIEHHD